MMLTYLLLKMEKKMSFLIDRDQYPCRHWFAETTEFALASSGLTAGFGYILHVSKIVHLTNPLQGGVYGAVAALVLSVAVKLITDENDDVQEGPIRYFALAGSVVVATGITYTMGFPMSYAAGACLFPAVVVANRVAALCRDWAEDRYNRNCR